MIMGHDTKIVLTVMAIINIIGFLAISILAAIVDEWLLTLGTYGLIGLDLFVVLCYLIIWALAKMEDKLNY